MSLAGYLSSDVWPGDSFAANDAGFLDSIAVDRADVLGGEQSLTADLALRVMDELVFDLPVGCALVLGQGSVAISASADPDGFQIHVTADLLKLRLPRSLFVPVIEQNGELVVDPDQTHFVDISLPLGLSVDQDWNIEVELPGETTSGVNLPQCMIGDSGVIVSAEDIILRLSTNQPLPDGAEGAGVGPDWRGVFIGEAAILLPSSLGSAVPTDLTLQNCYIGTGGFSGSIGADWDPAFSGELLGATFGLSHLELTFVQNAPTASEIRGTIELPFFDKELEIDVSFDVRGNLSVSLSGAREQGDSFDPTTGLLTLTKPNVLEIELDSLGFEVAQNTFTAKLSGKITPLVGGLNWPAFQVKELAIDSHGNVHIEGGWINLADHYSVNLYGFRLEISRVGFGTEDDGTRWIGFSGGLRLVEGLPLGGSVDGLKIKWKDADIHLELKGVGVQFEIPGALKLDGKVQFIDEPSKKGFKGGVKLTIIPTNVVVDAQIVVGKNSESPEYTFVYVFIAGDLPVGIPLLSTGLSLYGLAGLFGYNMAPDKRENDPWFDGWYLRNPIGASDASKWTDHRDSLALGAGVTLGTAADNGYAFNAKVLLILLLPGPIILIDGKAAFLQNRGSGDPQLKTLAVIDGRAGTLLFNVQAHYAYPTPGAELIDVSGGAEVFFDFGNPGNWHLYLGMDQPEDKRIRAKIIQLFEANAYLMLTSADIRLGAKFGYNAHWGFGPLDVVLEAWIEGAARLSWSPVQFEGSLHLHGHVALKVFGFSIGLGLDALLEVKTPNPYYVHVRFHVSLDLPWPLPDPEATIDLTWDSPSVPDPPRPLEAIGLEHLKSTEKWLMATDSANAPVVPLDARPVLSFQRAMNDGTGVAQNPLPSAPETVGGYLFEYHLDSIQLDKRPHGGGTWVDATTPSDPSAPLGELWGSWLAVNASIREPSPQDTPSMTKLMLWSKTPFDYGREVTSSGPTDGFLQANPSWPCGYVWTPTMECDDFRGVAEGAMPSPLARGRLVMFGEGIRILNIDGDAMGPRLAAQISSTPPSVSSKHAAPSEGKGPGVLRILFPSGVAAAYLYLARTEQAFYKVEGRSPVEIDEPKKPVLVTVDPADLTFVDLYGTFLLVQVCFVMRHEWDRVKRGEAGGQQLANSAGDVASALAKILEPHTDYRLTTQTHVRRSGNRGATWDDLPAWTDQTYFRTESPPGMSSGGGPATSDLGPTQSSEHYPDRGPLKDLTAYILHTIPTHGANPVYRSYDIGVDFNESYVDAMYILEGTPLALILQDSNGLPVLDTAGEPLPTVDQWADLDPVQADETSRPEETSWVDAVSNCADMSGTSSPPPQGIWARHRRLLLAPLTGYRALVSATTPIAIIPLERDGTMTLDPNGVPLVLSISGDSATKSHAIENAGTGRKLVTDGRVIVETDYGASAGSSGFDATSKHELAVVHQALDLLVRIEPPRRPVYTWAFTTSRFASFIHHVQSFPESVGDYQKSLTADERTWLENVVRAHGYGVPINQSDANRETESMEFDKVLSVLALDGRTLPGAFQITLLRDATASYGLLIESPEPLPWERVGLTIQVKAMDIGSTLDRDAETKMIGVGFALTDAQLDDEFVDILLLASLDPTGLKLQRQDAIGTWVDYYQFRETEVLPEGSVVRIHSGAAAGDAAPDPEIDNRYAADAGGPTTRQFGADSVRLRIVDQSGTMVHERSFAASGFDNRYFRILRSRDGTRMMIFFPTGPAAISSVPQRTIRTMWTFERNILPKEPVLRRMGSAKRETTILDFVARNLGEA